MLTCTPSALLKASRCLCMTPRQRLAAAGAVLCKDVSKGLPGIPLPPPTPGFAFPTPAGFAVASNISGTVLTASWNNPPGGVTGTEIWTSSNGVTYALDTTVAAGFTSHFYGAIAVGSFQYFKIRFTNGAGGFSDFTTPIEWSGQAMDWAARVLTNSGDLDNVNRIFLVNNLWCTLVNGGVSSDILCLNPFGGVFSAGLRTLSACATPLIKGAGLDPWLTQGFSNNSCTVNGVACGVGNFFNTGFNLTAYASDNNVGACVYDVTGTSEVTRYVFGVFDGVSNDCGMWTNNGGTTEGFALSFGTPVTGAAPGVGGFYGVHRVAAADTRLFFGNSNNTPAQLGGTQAAAGGTRFAQPFFVGSLNNNGGTALETSHVLSAWCATNGLTLAKFTTVFNAFQAYRVAMGGGFV